MGGFRRLAARGIRLDAADYDGRTAVHLVASEGHQHIVEFFLRQGVPLDARDRWGNRPVDDAVREGHEEVAKRLAEAGKVT